MTVIVFGIASAFGWLADAFVCAGRITSEQCTAAAGGGGGDGGGGVGGGGGGVGGGSGGDGIGGDSIFEGLSPPCCYPA